MSEYQIGWTWKDFGEERKEERSGKEEILFGAMRHTERYVDTVRSEYVFERSLLRDDIYSLPLTNLQPDKIKVSTGTHSVHNNLVCLISIVPGGPRDGHNVGVIQKYRDPILQIINHSRNNGL